VNIESCKILVVDDDEDVLHAARLFLKQHAAIVETERDPERIPVLLHNVTYDVILLDMNFTRDVTSGTEGFHWLEHILEIDPSAVVVLITAYGDVEMAVRAIKEGATDFVLKPWQNEKLLATIFSAVNLRRTRKEADHLRLRQWQLSADLDQPFHHFVGSCSAIRRVFGMIDKVAQTDANVLILGENGTGKELVAREIHRRSGRSREVFISVDMGAVSESLFESELFGHVKGAFTDAREDRAGRFEIADGGTLFLDEIGNLSLHLQAKLMNILENREVIRVGSNRPISVDIRLICATNRPVHEMAARGEFRDDLLYRINTVEIELPPLRERGGDIPLLIDHFLDRYCRKYRAPRKRPSAATLNKLERYRWPGNVRELQHAIERAVIMSESTVLQPTDFFFPTRETTGDGIVLESYNLEEIERLAIQKAIRKNGGNISRAATELGLTRASLYRRMEKYGL
jgi:DNA-binding NtrC family response regulator